MGIRVSWVCILLLRDRGYNPLPGGLQGPHVQGLLTQAQGSDGDADDSAPPPAQRMHFRLWLFSS